MSARRSHIGSPSRLPHRDKAGGGHAACLAPPASPPKKLVSMQLALGAVIFAAALAAHAPAIHAGYTWDDSVFLYQCPLVTEPDGLHRSWFTLEGTDYWPLMTTMFWFEWRIWGNNPMPFHAMNIVLHAMAAVLLWRVLLRLKINSPGAFLSALIFAVHPVTVESVAWIAERKNVLSMTFFWLALLTFIRFESSRRPGWYAITLVMAAATMLSKSSTVVLPVVILLMVWWLYDRLGRRHLYLSLPMFAMSLILGLVQMWCVREQIDGGEIGRTEDVASRIAAVGWIVWFYLYKIVLPINLAMIYPRWDVDSRQIMSYLPLLLLGGLFAVLWRYRRSWGRTPLAALAYFLIAIAPVAGLLNMQFHRYTLVADHLQYLGMPAIIALIGGGIGAVWLRTRQRSGTPHAVGTLVLAAAIVLTCGVLTWRQATVYQDEVDLWSQTISMNERCWAAYNHRGMALDKKGDYDRALQDYNKAVEIKPNFSFAYANRAWTHGNKGDYDLQIRDCNVAIALHPEFVEAYYYRGFAYYKKRLYDQAIDDLSKAIELKPEAEFFFLRATCYEHQDDLERKIGDCTQAIALRPDYAKAYNSRGTGYAGMQDYTRAIKDFTKCLELNDAYAEAYMNRAVAYYSIQAYQQAWADVKRSRQLGKEPHPSFIKALTEASGR